MASSARTLTTLRTWMVGGGYGSRLHDALSSRSDVKLLGAGENGSASVEGVDVVLIEAGPHDDFAAQLASVRERVSVPVVFAVVEEARDRVNEVIALNPDDIIVLPQPADVVAFVLRKAATGGGSGAAGRDRAAGKVITVFSPKGGTGKSVIATNLAVGLSSILGLRTVLLDLDLQFGDAGLMLGLPRGMTLYDVISAPGEIDAEKLDGFLLEHKSGLRVLASPPRPQDGDRIDDKRGGTLVDVARTAFDAVVIDTAPLFDLSMLTALDRTDELLLLCGHDLPSLKNVLVSRDTLDLLSFPRDRVSVVANRRGMRGGLKTSEVAEILGGPPRFVVPEDDLVPSSVNRGVAPITADDKNAFAEAIVHIGSELLDAARVQPSKRSLFGSRRA